MKMKVTHNLTLRIEPEMDSMIVDAAYDARTSKATWIRGAIHQRLARKRRPGTDMEERTK
jgi:hypothetical protein